MSATGCCAHFRTLHKNGLSTSHADLTPFQKRVVAEPVPLQTTLHAAENLDGRATLPFLSLSGQPRKCEDDRLGQMYLSIVWSQMMLPSPSPSCQMGKRRLFVALPWASKIIRLPLPDLKNRSKFPECSPLLSFSCPIRYEKQCTCACCLLVHRLPGDRGKKQMAHN